MNNNNNRIPTVSWWHRFIGDTERIQRFKVGGLEYNREDLVNYVRVQCASSLKAFVDMHGGDIAPLLDIIDSAKLNFKQRDLLRRLEITNYEEND